MTYTYTVWARILVDILNQRGYECTLNEDGLCATLTEAEGKFEITRTADEPKTFCILFRQDVPADYRRKMQEDITTSDEVAQLIVPDGQIVWT